MKARNITQQAIDVLKDLENVKPGEEYEAGMPVDIMAGTLLDYINNLENRIKELEQINEEHRELNGKLRTANNNLCEVEEFMYNQAKDYKTRNKEAIEYMNKSIDNHTDWYNYIHGDEDGEVHNLDILLNILQNGEENE